MSKAADPVAEMRARARDYRYAEQEKLFGQPIVEHDGGHWTDERAAAFALSELRRLGASGVPVAWLIKDSAGCDVLVHSEDEAIQILAEDGGNGSYEPLFKAGASGVDVEGLARELRDAAYKTRETYSRHLYQDEVETLIREHIAQPDGEREKDLETAAELLEEMYGKWEDGSPCFEDPETGDGYMGHAIELGDREDEIVAVLNRLFPPAPTKEQDNG